MTSFCDRCGRRFDGAGACSCGPGLDGPTVALARRAVDVAIQQSDIAIPQGASRMDLAARVARRRALVATAVGTVFVLGLLGLILGFGAAKGAFSTSATASPTAASGGAGATPVALGSDTTASGSDTGTDPESALDARRVADRAALSVSNAWYPQVSSKRVGLVADGITYDDAAIWRQFQTILAAHPEARLLRSDDWAGFKQRGFWVTIMDDRASTAAQANAWCDAQGFPADQCFARRLGPGVGSTGSTVPRR